MNPVVVLFAVATLLLSACDPHGMHTAPPTVCAVPCVPPDVSPHWCAASAAWVESCASMHEECRGWVMTHFEDE